MSFTEVKSNLYNFSEVTNDDKQPLVTNNLGRDVVYGEFVYLDGYFGEVREYGGIANGAQGRINIDGDRIVSTQQVEATDTFVEGNTLWFVSGGAGGAGTFQDADPGSGTRYACGIITGEEGTGGAQTAVRFRPFLQRLDAADQSAQVAVNTADIATLQAEMLVEQAEPKKLVFRITADGSSGLAITGLSEGDEIIDAYVIATVAESNGTVKITDGTNDITDAFACAVDKVKTSMGTLDDAHNVIGVGDTATVITGGDTAANTRGILVVTYIPA